MKKIINGKKYDTETAKEVGRTDNELSVNDFYYFHETLYQKKTGEFFIYGRGGAASKYSEPCGANASCGGEKIVPLTLEEAKAWGEKNLSVDHYEEAFGNVSE